MFAEMETDIKSISCAGVQYNRPKYGKREGEYYQYYQWQILPIVKYPTPLPFSLSFPCKQEPNYGVRHSQLFVDGSPRTRG
jgi:hypothetical protein